LMSTLNNGMGGSTTITYSASSLWPNTYLPVGMVFQAPTATTTNDGRGIQSTVAFSYAGALWSDADRRLLGFATLLSVVDALGDYAVTHYHQHVGCVNKPDPTYLFNLSNNIIGGTTFTYAESSSAPFTSVMTGSDVWKCDGTTATADHTHCREVFTGYGYDVY